MSLKKKAFPKILLVLALLALLSGVVQAQKNTLSIELTSVPKIGSFENLFGRVNGVNPSQYKVAVYLYGSGWYNKPTWAQPITTIHGDYSWTTDITTGQDDENAIKIAVFLIPIAYTPPLLRGEVSLPQELFNRAVAFVMVSR